MQAIDEQVDQLASAAGKALGSFWTGLGGALNSGMQAASNIAGQIETAAAQAASRVSETTKEHAPWCAASPSTHATGSATLQTTCTSHLQHDWAAISITRCRLPRPSTVTPLTLPLSIKRFRTKPQAASTFQAVSSAAAILCYPPLLRFISNPCKAALESAAPCQQKSRPRYDCRSGRSGGGRTSTGGTLVLPPGGLVEDEWQVVDLLGSPSTSVAASFEQLFKLYRGPRFVDDLEAIGNEAARSCNRVRAGLPGAVP